MATADLYLRSSPAEPADLYLAARGVGEVGEEYVRSVAAELGELLGAATRRTYVSRSAGDAVAGFSIAATRQLEGARLAGGTLELEAVAVRQVSASRAAAAVLDDFEVTALWTDPTNTRAVRLRLSVGGSGVRVLSVETV